MNRQKLIEIIYSFGYTTFSQSSEIAELVFKKLREEETQHIPALLKEKPISE